MIRPSRAAFAFTALVLCATLLLAARATRTIRTTTAIA
jgi:hypothetical protein